MITINITGDNAEQVMAELRVLAGMSFRLPSDTIVHHVSASMRDERTGPQQSDTSPAPEEENQKPSPKTGKARGSTKKDAAQSAEKTADDTHAASDEATTVGTTASDAPAAADERKKFDSPDDQLDYETEVAPLVLKAVDTAGRDKVKSVLDQFGVTRASQIEPSRWPELVALLQDLG
jgi:hypothetical protein